MSEGIYNDYDEKTYCNDELQIIFDKYTTWMQNNGQAPEVSHIKDIDESNIGHVVYHAELMDE